MEKHTARIVFMGTPDFAVPCLESLINEDYNVVGVFSQPDRPQGRGYKLFPTPVKQLALKHDIPVFQPKTLRNEEAFAQLSELAPDLIVVVAFGQILPDNVLSLPELGCINVHGSLLPKLRGAAPIQWSILNGDKITGVSTMYIASAMDAGDIILKKETPIGENETSGELFERLAPLGAELLLETVPLILSGNAPRVPQDHSLATLAPMIKKPMAELDFSWPAQKVKNWVRGMSPWPAAFTFINGLRVVVEEVEIIKNQPKASPGEIIDNRELVVACADGAVKLVQVKPAGKKSMPGGDFANGQRLKIGEKFTHSTQNV